jgi:hypothetical protein
MSQKFIESLPLLFGTATQKATMCNFLWNTNEDPVTVVHNLRMYDIVRRLYYVKTGEEPTSSRVLELMHFIKNNDDMDSFFMFYCTRGIFPDNNTLQLLKY